MQSDHRVVLHLLAIGRLTPAEAERLLLAANDSREGIWMFAAVMVIACVAELSAGHLPAELNHAFTAILPASLAVIHQVSSNVIRNLGGVL
jgi:hypothetical protein